MCPLPAHTGVSTGLILAQVGWSGQLSGVGHNLGALRAVKLWRWKPGRLYTVLALGQFHSPLILGLLDMYGVREYTEAFCRNDDAVFTYPRLFSDGDRVYQTRGAANQPGYRACSPAPMRGLGSNTFKRAGYPCRGLGRPPQPPMGAYEVPMYSVHKAGRTHDCGWWLVMPVALLV